MSGNQKIIRWGIIGGGNVVENKSGPAFNVEGKSRVHAVFRRKIEDAEKTRILLKAKKAYSSFDDMLRDEDIDAYYLALPPGLHFKYAMKCAGVNKPVYIEKPLTTKYEDAKKLVLFFDKKSIPVFVAHYRRSLDRFIKAKELIRGRLGEIVRFDYKLSRKREDDANHPWLYDKELSGGGKFADIAPHSLDIFQFFFGELSDVKSFFRHMGAPNNTEDFVSLMLRFCGGVIGTAVYDFLSSKKEDSFVVYGLNGSLEMSFHGEEPVVLKTKQETVTFNFPFPEFIQEKMIQDVIDFLRDGNGAPCFAKNSINTIRVIEDTLNGIDSVEFLVDDVAIA